MASNIMAWLHDGGEGEAVTSFHIFEGDAWRFFLRIWKGWGAFYYYWTFQFAKIVDNSIIVNNVKEKIYEY